MSGYAPQGYPQGGQGGYGQGPPQGGYPPPQGQYPQQGAYPGQGAPQQKQGGRGCLEACLACACCMCLCEMCCDMA